MQMRAFHLLNGFLRYVFIGCIVAVSYTEYYASSKSYVTVWPNGRQHLSRVVVHFFPPDVLIRQTAVRTVPLLLLMIKCMLQFPGRGIDRLIG